MPIPTTEHEWRVYFTDWGAQTILYAMSVKGNMLGRELNPTVDLAFVNAARDEAVKIAHLDLWSKALEETAGKFADSTGLRYNQLVLEWCAKHLGFSKTPPAT